MTASSPAVVAGACVVAPPCSAASLSFNHAVVSRHIRLLEEWRACFRHNAVSISPSPSLACCYGHAHLTIGAALASRYLVARDLADGALVELTFPGIRRAVIGSYIFVTREDRWDKPPVARLRRFLQSHTQGNTN